MPPKKPTPALKPAAARGTLQHMWANAPKAKSKVERVKERKPREFMTLEERDDMDREEEEAAQGLRGAQLGGQMDGGDDLEGTLMKNYRDEIIRDSDGKARLVSPRKEALTMAGLARKVKAERMTELVARNDELKGDEGEESGRRSPRKHASTPVPDSRPGRGVASKVAASKRTMQKDGGMHEDERSQSGRRSPRKHASTPVPDLPPSRVVSKTIKNTIEADEAMDEAPQSGRRSPRKHASTPVPASRSATPLGKDRDPNRPLKRTGSTLSRDPTKTRRTISPEQKVRFSTEPQTPQRKVTRLDQEKTPVVELPAFDPDWHKAIVSPVKKSMELPKKEDSRAKTVSRRSAPVATTNGVSASRPKAVAQNGSTPKKVMKRIARSDSMVAESPGRGKRSRTGTPKTTPPKIQNGFLGSSSALSTLTGTPSPVKKATPPKKDKSSSVLSPLEDSPSPPPSMKPEPEVNNSSFTNGKSSQSHRTVVEDTDAESEDDSDDSLVDMQSLIRNGRNVTTVPHVPSPAKPRAIDRKGVLPTVGKEKKYKFSLKSLVIQMEVSERTDESAAKVKKMMADKIELEKNPSKDTSGLVTPHDGHAKLLEEAAIQKAGEGGDDVQKVLKALKRANVTASVEMVCHFFETGKPKKIWPERNFPKELLDTEGPNALWHEMFGDKRKREMGLQDDFLARMVKPDLRMSEPMFHWVLEELAKERDERLRYGYLHMLLSAPLSIMELLKPDVVRMHFRMLGAKKDALLKDKEMVQEPLQENPYTGRTRSDHWGELLDFLELLGHAAPILPDDTREYAFGVILRLCADKVVRTHVAIQEAVKKALMLLSEACGWEEWEVVSTRISQHLYTSIPSAGILIRLLSTIPARPRLHNLRRRLAYASFLQNPSLLQEPIHSTFSIDKLTSHLETKRFTTSRDTNDAAYKRLNHDIQLLDTALDSGSSSTAPKLGQRHLYYARLEVGDDAPLKLSAGEKDKEFVFNEQCDVLSQRLNVILNGIQDLGPGHAERSAVRATIGAVRNRVEVVVRTFVAVKRRGVGQSGGGGRESERRSERERRRGKKFLAGFLKRGGGEMEEGDGDGDGDGDTEVEAEAQLLLARYA